MKQLPLIRKVLTGLLVSFLLGFTPSGTEASVTLAWDPVTTNTDGSPCTDLAGYKVYYDTDGSGASYNGTGLNQGDSPIIVPLSSLADSANPQFVLSGLTPDTDYYIVVTSYDTNSNESGYSSEVTAMEPQAAGNDPPTAFIGAAPTQGMAPLTVSFSGTGTDTDGTVTDYAWTFGDGSSANVQDPLHTYDMPGNYTATLTVTDDAGGTGTETIQILVSEPPPVNSPPQVSISADPRSGPAPLTVTFASTASDSDGTIAAYSWTLGDNNNSQSQNLSHTYGMPGNYTVSLTVTDDAGDTATATVSVNVTDPAPDQDTDADGITDLMEMAQGLNVQSRDSDGDGLSDFTEWGPGSVPLDSDGDGTIDALDLDSDNDGKPDAEEGTGDMDGDGALNYIDNDDTDGPLGDQDQDGISNSTEVTYMINPNQSDSDGDGIDDGTEFGPLPWPLDSDGDGTIDALDLDSDNDGKSDAEEGTGDMDGDGAANYVDNDDTDGPEGDQDQDGFTNLQETLVSLNPNLSDSDGDGIPDTEEIANISAPADTDGDGIADALDPDSDGDGIPDSEESREDVDGNGRPDRLDGTTASLTGKQGKMALKLVTAGSLLSDTKYIQEAISTDKWKPSIPFKYGGIQFKATNVPVGASIIVEIIIDHDLNTRTQYWKYDPDTGYFLMDCTISGNTVSYILTDGGLGDSDHVANGIIVDPGFIAEPDEEPAVSTVTDSGGGGGCNVVKNSSGTSDGLLIFFPLLLLVVLKRMKEI